VNTTGTSPSVNLPERVVYDMQQDPNLATLNTSGIPFLARRTGAGIAFTVNMTSNPRTVTVTGRGGTSQGLEILVNDIFSVAKTNHVYRIEYGGRFPAANPTAVPRIRLEATNLTGAARLDENGAPAVGSVFNMSVTRSHPQLTADLNSSSGTANAAYGLGNASGTIDLVYTHIRVVEICLSTTCPCATQTTTAGTPQTTPQTTPPSTGLPTGHDVFNMHNHPELSALDTDGDGGSASSNGQIRSLPFAYRNSANSNRSVEVRMAAPRTITITGRTALQHGIGFRLNDIPIVTNHTYTFNVEGRLGTAAGGVMRIRNGIASSSVVLTEVNTTANGNFSMTLSRTAAQIQTDIATQGTLAVYNITPGGDVALPTIINQMRIIRSCPPACSNCVARTVNFNANGGSVNPSSMQTNMYTGQLASLPVPTRSGFKFLAWFTTSSGAPNTPIGRNHIFTQPTTEIFARWAPTGNIQGVTAEELHANLGIGWNYGNAFDGYNSPSCNSSCPCNRPSAQKTNTDVCSHYSTSFGNLLSSYSSWNLVRQETHWSGNTDQFTMSPQLVRNVHNAGFSTVRIPVSWHKAISGTSAQNRAALAAEINADFSTGFTIGTAFMNRVVDVVNMFYNYCSQNCNASSSNCPTRPATGGTPRGMNVILNSHHDDYLFAFNNNTIRNQSELLLGRLWDRVGARFRTHSERLIFEVLNEPRLIGTRDEWRGGNQEQQQNLNRLNQAAVRGVRGSGENNRYRILMIPTYAASAHDFEWDSGNTGSAFRWFVKPDDSTHNAGVSKLMLSVHSYRPGEYTGTNCLCDPCTAGRNCTNLAATWDTPERRQAVITMLNAVERNSRILEMPAVMGEFGSVARQDITSLTATPNSAEVLRAGHARFYVTEAVARRIKTVWWDTGVGGAVGRVEGRFGLFRRDGSGDSKGGHFYPHMSAAMRDGFAAGLARQ
jgi:endoglucanase